MNAAEMNPDREKNDRNLFSYKITEKRRGLQHTDAFSWSQKSFRLATSFSSSSFSSGNFSSRSVSSCVCRTTFSPAVITSSSKPKDNRKWLLISYEDSRSLGQEFLKTHTHTENNIGNVLIANKRQFLDKLINAILSGAALKGLKR